MRFFVLTILLLFAPLDAAAQSIEDQITTQLQDQGYVEVTMSRTFLGRLRIIALSAEFERELIVNPKTGQILRDRITPLDESGLARVSILPPATDNGSDQEAQNPVEQSNDRPPPPSRPRDGNPPPRP